MKHSAERVFENCDRQRMVMVPSDEELRAAGTVIVSMAYGFMEEVGAPHASLIWVSAIWAFFFGAGMLWSTWRYR